MGKQPTRTSKDDEYRFPSMPMPDIECLGDFYDYIYEHFEEALGDKTKTLNILRNKFLVTTMDDLERILILSMEKLEEDFGPTDDHENMENFHKVKMVWSFIKHMQQVYDMEPISKPWDDTEK